MDPVTNQGVQDIIVTSSTLNVPSVAIYLVINHAETVVTNHSPHDLVISLTETSGVLVIVVDVVLDHFTDHSPQVFTYLGVEEEFSLLASDSDLLIVFLSHGPESISQPTLVLLLQSAVHFLHGDISSHAALIQLLLEQ